MNRLLLLIPLGVFLLIGSFGIAGLFLDQTVQPSNLIDKGAPEFELTDMPGFGEAFTREDLNGQVTLINIFGSWCIACRAEHEMLKMIHRSNEVPLYGINWIDTPEQGAQWLNEFGNSYHRVGNDQDGRNIIELGVTGAPETFVIDQEGRIRYRHVGPITMDIWTETLQPMVRELQGREAPTASI